MQTDGGKKILIAGAGELGSRYLQSVSTCKVPLEVHLLSNNPQSLDICAIRWAQANEGSSAHTHKVFYHTELGSLPDSFDVVIVASTADSRPLLVESIAKRSQVTYWIIEKVIAQSIAGVEFILTQVSGASNSWVNYYMTSQTWYEQIKGQLGAGSSKHMEIRGGDWGLACNALHFFHLFEWFSGEQLISMDGSCLAEAWHESKRPGHWEVFGEIKGEFSNGGTVRLIAESGPPQYSLVLHDGELSWRIDEPTGVARRSDGFEVRGRVPFQSERRLVEEILCSGTCGLPTLTGIANADKSFIGLMLDHWQKCNDPSAHLVPIT